MALFALTATFAPAIGPDHRRISDRKLRLAIHLFHQPRPRHRDAGWPDGDAGAATVQLDLLKQGDWFGIAAMAIGLSALQTVLEEGNKDDWFGSPLIVRLAIIAAVSLTLFVCDRIARAQSCRQFADSCFAAISGSERWPISCSALRSMALFTPAPISRPGARLQFRTNRLGDGMDRVAPAFAHSPRPETGGKSSMFGRSCRWDCAFSPAVV